MMSKILISGYHGYGNCGDEAILVAMIRNLRQLQPGLDLVALSKLQDQTALVYGIRCVNRFNLLQIIREMRSADLVLSGGGSLLQDVTSNRSLYYYLGIILLARLLRRPVMLYANGIGPINRRYNHRLTRCILNLTQTITLRDSESCVLLKKLGVDRPGLQVTADPVLTLAPVAGDRALNICRAEGIDIDRPLVGISVRPWKAGTDFLPRMAAITDALVEQGREVLFFPLHQSDDVRAITQVQALCRQPSHLLRGSYSAEDIMSVIGLCQVFISMRLHGLVFAAVENVPMIGLVYDPKVQSFLDSLQQPGIADLDQLDPESFLEMIARVEREREKLAAGLEARIKGLREQARRNDQIVMEMLSKRYKA